MRLQKLCCVLISWVGLAACCITIHAQELNQKSETKPLVEPDFPAKIEVVAEKPGKDGKQRVAVELTLEKDFYVYANPVGPEDLQTVQTTMTVTGKKPPASVQVTYPKGESFKLTPFDTMCIYTGKVKLVAVVERAAGDTEPLWVIVTLLPRDAVKGVCHWPPTQLKKSFN